MVLLHSDSTKFSGDPQNTGGTGVRDAKWRGADAGDGSRVSYEVSLGVTVATTVRFILQSQLWLGWHNSFVCSVVGNHPRLKSCVRKWTKMVSFTLVLVV